MYNNWCDTIDAIVLGIKWVFLLEAVEIDEEGTRTADDFNRWFHTSTTDIKIL